MRPAMLLACLTITACANAAGQYPRESIQAQLDNNARQQAAIAAQLGEELGTQASCGLPSANVAERRMYYAQVTTGGQIGLNRQMILASLEDAYQRAASPRRDPRSSECRAVMPTAPRS